MGLRMKNLGFVKNPIFRGNHDKPIKRRLLSKKRGTWTTYRFKRGLAERRGMFLWEGIDTPNAHYGNY